MLVSELIATIKADPDYITNSLYLKSNDTLGGVYKYLLKFPSTEQSMAYRKEIFIAAEGTEGDDFTARTVITSIEVLGASLAT